MSPTAALPTRFTPQLATLVTTVPDSDDWLHEIKFDGYRIGARIDHGKVTLITRAGNDWTTTFPEVRDAVAKLPVRQALLDGEVAAVLSDGRTSFQALQKWLSGTGTSDLVYFVFDLLHLDGEDVARLPLEERKSRLEALVRALPSDSLIRYSAHVIGGGRRFFAAASERGLEGIISKRRGKPYDAGRRGGWTKRKCLQRQAMVIGGFTDSSDGVAGGLGALLLGVYDDGGTLRFAGKVGTGFTQRSAADVRARLERRARKTTPFANPPAEARRWGAHWVEPTLVADVKFSEWTDDGRLRQSSFQGLRDDVAAGDVVREGASPEAATEPKTAPRRMRGAVVKAPRVAAPPKGSTTLHGVRLTHPERVLYPEVPLTKLELARYYEDVAEWILPHVAGRPLSLVRCPTGLGSCFYVKHATHGDPAVLRRVDVKEKDDVNQYSVVDGVPGLMALVQMSILEIHPWNSVAEDLERPDRVIIDLDPGPEVGWPQVLEAAELVRIAFETLGLQSFVKTTGGKGLHVVAPFVPDQDWDTCLAFVRGVSDFIVRQHPKLYTTAMPKRGREKKILLDYYRNHRGSTAIAAFSTRARDGAPVSVPLAWGELSPKLTSDHFTVGNVRTRLARLKRDPWREYWTLRQRISAKALAAMTS